MKPLSPSEVSLYLSLAADGALTPEERARLDAYLTGHPEARKELQELESLKRLLGTHPRVPSGMGLWAGLSRAMDEHDAEQHNLLPIPRKLFPAAAVVGAASLLVAGFALFRNYDSILRFMADQKEAVKEVYEQGVLKGSLLPVFSDIDKNQALQFALFGFLPIDQASGTTLRVDESAEQGYRLEVGAAAQKHRSPVTMDKFMSDLRPNVEQREAIDSVLEFLQHRIASSVLVDAHDVMAIDPELPRLTKVSLSNIAAVLNTRQREQVERMLAEFDAPYTIPRGGSAPVAKEKIIASIRQAPAPNRWVVVTEDSSTWSEVQIDVDMIHRNMEQEMGLERELDVRRARLFERLARRDVQGQRRVHIVSHPPHATRPEDTRGHVLGMDEVMFSPEIPEPMFMVVKPRIRKDTFFAHPGAAQGFELRFSADSSGDASTRRVRVFQTYPGGSVMIESHEEHRAPATTGSRVRRSAVSIDSGRVPEAPPRP